MKDEVTRSFSNVRLAIIASLIIWVAIVFAVGAVGVHFLVKYW